MLGKQVGAVVEGNAGKITSRPVEAWHEAGFDRVCAGSKHDGYRAGRRLGGVRLNVASGYDYGAPIANEIGHQFRQSLPLILRPAEFDHEVLSLGIAGFSEAASQCRHEVGRSIG